AGLKGTRLGAIAVSTLHANFFINAGGAGSAKATEVVDLVRQVRAIVAHRFGITLVPEIQLAGEWDDVSDLLAAPNDPIAALSPETP
ncbi:MAG: hypothetical protein ACRC1H_08485, partial [Caldilineaceae bacterium]